MAGFNGARSVNLGDEGSIGTLGSSSVSIHPSSRYDSTFWTDDIGTIYIFGGISAYGKCTLLCHLASR
jgi:hypothetical protein